jgi:D-alanine-D-alanine ligase
MLAIKTHSAPRTRRGARKSARGRVVTPASPRKVLVGYSAVEKLSRGEPRDLETDLETIQTAPILAQNLCIAGYDAETYVVHTLDDVDFVAENFDLNDLLFFNLCEHLDGVATDDVKITLRMDRLGIHYTGAPTATLQHCLDKARTKHILGMSRIPTAPYEVFTRVQQPNRVPLPAIVKPVAEDASMGITRESVVFGEQQLRERVEYVLDVYRQPALVEEYIIGREFNVGLWGNGELHTLPLAELSFANWSDPYQQFCHFDAKWNPDAPEYQTMPVICPAEVDQATADRIYEVARRTYGLLGGRDYARVDLRVRDGEPYVLEVNPNPCLAPDAGFPNAARVAGFEYPAMATRIAQWAWWRRGRDV